jgi:ferrochelatase
MTKTAVVLFNLGGPDRPEAVRPFLQNLFSDPAILGVPQPLRAVLAGFIARRRAPVAAEIYARIGGGSPLLPNTQAQAAALETALADLGAIRVFVAMRYWHPLIDQVAAEVRAFAPDRLVLLPLYPQFSTTTTASALQAWVAGTGSAGLGVPVHTVCCYPAEQGFIGALAALIRPAYERARTATGLPPRLLFTAHGLPRRVVDRGDPYQAQVEMTAAAVIQALAIPGLDARISYQSRVGPLEWLRPYTEDELRRAGAGRVPLVVAPIAFVSEHSETLVELDMTYREEALELGVPHYERVPTVGTHPAFIAGLAATVRTALAGPACVAAEGRMRLCPPASVKCAMAAP